MLQVAFKVSFKISHSITWTNVLHHSKHIQVMSLSQTQNTFHSTINKVNFIIMYVELKRIARNGDYLIVRALLSLPTPSLHSIQSSQSTYHSATCLV